MIGSTQPDRSLPITGQQRDPQDDQQFIYKLTPKVNLEQSVNTEAMFLKYKKKREHADDMVQYEMKKQSQVILNFFELLKGGLEYCRADLDS